MIKKFSPRAHRLLSVTAREIAKKMGSNQLVPEHMLIGLIQTVDCVGYAVLRYLKISTLTLHLILEKTIPLNNLNANFSDVLRSRRLQTFLDAALAESRSLRRDYIGTEHFLLAAVKEEQSAIQVYLQKNGISAEDVKSAIETVSLQMPSSAHEARIIPMGAVNMNNPMQAKQNPQESLLDEHCYDLTKKAQNGELDPVVGRQREIQRVIQILSRRNKNNPVLVGEPGVGKTAIAEGLAQCIADERVPNNLLGKRLLSLDLASVIAGTKYRGEFEKRIKKIMKEISEQKNIILFIDELHTIIGAGGAEGSMDASNML
ncbi:MAG: Clp protease N-terminal domain-containing protein, partial [Spirochaetales bacterium]